MLVRPQRNLVNFRGNIWVTPNTPQMPNYDNMFSRRFADFNFDLVRDSCNIGLQVTPVLAHIVLPSFQVVLRSPGCSPPPFRPIPPIGEEPYQHYFDDAEIGFLFSFQGSPGWSYENNNITQDTFGSINRPPHFFGEAWAMGEVRMDLLGSRFPVPENERKYIGTYVVSFNPVRRADAFANLEWTFKRRQIYTANDRFRYLIQNIREDISPDFNDVKQVNNEETFKGYAEVSTNDSGVPVSIVHRQYYKIVDNEEIPISLLRDFYAVQIIERDEIRVRFPEERDNEITFYQESPDLIKISRRKVHLVFVAFNYNPSPPPPPPPPPPPEMNCCPELRRLLLLVLQKIGSADLPATVPKSLSQKNSPPIKIENLAQFISYGIQQENAQIGAFPQEIKIQDSDLTQEGNQSQTVELPNLAESLAEIVGILLLIQTESSATLSAAVNAMIEAGAAKQSAIIANDILLANAEYFGYQLDHTTKEVPFSYTPGEEKLDKALQPNAKVKVKTYKNGDKDNLLDLVAPILEMAAMYRVQNFVNLGTGDIAQSLKNKLLDSLKFNEEANNLTRNNPNPNNPNPEDWDDFLNQSEQGFITQPGITDTTQPYGRPLDQRPRIREIGNTSEPDA